MKYLIRKVCTLIITLFVISLLSFLAFQVIPGDAALSKLGTGATEQKRERLRREMGLDRPVLEQYGIWLKNFGQGDMGESYTYSLPVSEMIREKMPANLAITAMSFLLMLAVSIPLGLLAGRFAGRLPDRILTVCNQVVMAVPGFFMGILITCVFGLALHWFTPGGYVSYQESWSGFLGYLVFPSIAIALPKCAMGIKLLRSSVIGELGQDYVRTAYSRGNSQAQVLLIHVLKNSLLPILTFWALAIADIVASSVILEQVFTIPGLGTLLVQSISNRDYPVVQALIVLIAGLVVTINFLVDLLYGIIDPRIELRG